MDAILVCGGIVEKDGKILLVQEGKKSAYGLWNVPAGKIDLPEKIIDCAIREIKEETGLDVRLDGLIGVYQYSAAAKNAMTIRFQFKASIISGTLRAQEGEILDVKWFTPKDILAMDETKLRSPMIKASVRDYLAGKLYPVDAIKYLK